MQANPTLELARKLVREGKFQSEHEAQTHIVEVYNLSLQIGELTSEITMRMTNCEVALLDAQDAAFDFGELLRRNGIIEA